MTTLVYADCDPFAFVEELKTLFPLHYEELCVTKDFPLAPDYDAYKRLKNCSESSPIELLKTSRFTMLGRM